MEDRKIRDMVKCVISSMLIVDNRSSFYSVWFIFLFPQQYEAFYGKQFSGRKLTWLHHLSSGDIKLGYLAKPYIVNMTTFQVSL